MSEPILISPSDLDDSAFIELITKLLNHGVSIYKPRDVYLIKIDHWFDYKWRGFSGKTLGALGVWLNNLTIPPFIPSRVVEESYFRFDENSGNYYFTNSNPLHVYQPSSNNFHRSLSRQSSSLFVWFSSKTKKQDRASLMFYSIKDGDAIDVYASFKKAQFWKPTRVEGMPRKEFLSFFE